MERTIITELYDAIEDEIMMLISHTTTTTKGIENVIRNVKNTYENDWTIEDIIEALPDDCEIISVNDVLYV